MATRISGIWMNMGRRILGAEVMIGDQERGGRKSGVFGGRLVEYESGHFA
jgi:hypothetical protein